MPARLTIDQFIAELREKTGREGTEWHLTPTGRLRTYPDGLCPLRELMGDVDYQRAARQRGMSQKDVDNVMDAADWNGNRPTVRAVRAQLLAATGVA